MSLSRNSFNFLNFEPVCTSAHLCSFVLISAHVPIFSRMTSSDGPLSSVNVWAWADLSNSSAPLRSAVCLFVYKYRLISFDFGHKMWFSSFIFAKFILAKFLLCPWSYFLVCSSVLISAHMCSCPDFYSFDFFWLSAFIPEHFSVSGSA